MNPNYNLSMYEELALLAIGDKTGNVLTQYFEVVTAAAILAELALEGHIDISKDDVVELVSDSCLDDPVLGLALSKLKTARITHSAKDWISRISSINGFRKKVAMRLCDRGILKAKEENVLGLFSRQFYPELDPGPELALRESIRSIVLKPEQPVTPRLSILLGLIQNAGLLNGIFSPGEIASHKKRIDAITKGEELTKASAEIIRQTQAAGAMMAIMPIMMMD